MQCLTGVRRPCLSYSSHIAILVRTNCANSFTPCILYIAGRSDLSEGARAKWMSLAFYSFLKWVNLLMSDGMSVINHCGNVSDRFHIERGCRQGCPFSPYLFILCVEILALKIREFLGGVPQKL